MKFSDGSKYDARRDVALYVGCSKSDGAAAVPASTTTTDACSGRISRGEIILNPQAVGI